VLLFWFGAPTTTVSPLIATLAPNQSSRCGATGWSMACHVQLDEFGVAVNTNAAPRSSYWGAPNTAVFPSIATLYPNCDVGTAGGTSRPSLPPAAVQAGPRRRKLYNLFA